MNPIASRIPRRTFLATAIASLGATTRATSHPASEIVSLANPADYLVTHTAQFSPGEMNLLSLEIWLPIPTSDREQTISNVRVPPLMTVLEETTKTVNVARYLWTEKRGLPNTLELSYAAQISTVKADVAAVLATRWPEPDKPATTSLYTRRETAIQTDDAKIRAKAAELRKSTAGPGEFAQAAYNWVLDQTEYRRYGVLKGAKFCFEKHDGECGDYTALFVALCRSAQIPSRPAVGFLLDGKPNSVHVWAEFQIPSGEWIPVDCAQGDGNDRQRRAHFGIQDNKRLALARTFDIKLKKPTKGRTKVDILQSGSWWYAGQGEGTAPRCEFTLLGKPEPNADKLTGAKF